MNSLGKNLIFTSFGESHGKAIGGVLDGVAAGLRIDMEMIREALDRRAGRGDVRGERLEVILVRFFSVWGSGRGIADSRERV